MPSNLAGCWVLPRCVLNQWLHNARSGRQPNCHWGEDKSHSRKALIQAQPAGGGARLQAVIYGLHDMLLQKLCWLVTGKCQQELL